MNARMIGLALCAAALLAACSQQAAPQASPSPSQVAVADPTSPPGTPTPTPYTAPSDAPIATPIPSDQASAPPEPTPGATPPPGSTPFPTPGPTITPGSTRVIGTISRHDGSPAQGVCVVLQKGLCPIATDAKGVWFTDIPAGPINWNFIYKVDGEEVGRQFVLGTSGGELRLGAYTLTN